MTRTEDVLGGPPDAVFYGYCLHHLPDVGAHLRTLGKWLPKGPSSSLMRRTPARHRGLSRTRSGAWSSATRRRSDSAPIAAGAGSSPLPGSSPPGPSEGSICCRAFPQRCGGRRSTASSDRAKDVVRKIQKYPPRVSLPEGPTTLW